MRAGMAGHHTQSALWRPLHSICCAHTPLLAHRACGYSSARCNWKRAKSTIARRYSAAERAELAGGKAADWGRESWQISHDFIYPETFSCDPCEGELPRETALSQELIERSAPIARRRVLQAGAR